MYVIPIRKTFDPAKKDFLPKKGREVSQTPYWYKRIQKGSVKKIEVK